MRRVDRTPRIAIVSPWPPQLSGVADYAAKLAIELRHAYEIDAYHDPAIPPDFEGLGDGITPIPATLLPRLIGLRRYRALIYQMGNSRHHAFLYPLMLSHPGIVTLHDLRLTNFQEAYGEFPRLGRGHLRREIAHDRPGESAALLRELPAMRRERGGIPVALAARGIDLNRRVFETARAVVVHSQWGHDRAAAMFPDHAARTHRVPIAAKVETVSSERKSAIRERFGFPADAVIFASLGFLGWGKMNEEAIEAFAAIGREHPQAVLAFAGRDLDDGRALRRAQDLGIADRIRFFGATTEDDLCDLARITDIGVNLRREPTNGETSATLFMFLRYGVPTIVTDVDAFRDEPDEVVARISWRDDGMPGLVAAMRRLVLDRPARERIGRAAFEHLSRSHSWAHVVAKYAELIDSATSIGKKIGA